jgi:hypothetical protein
MPQENGKDKELTRAQRKKPQSWGEKNEQTNNEHENIGRPYPK